MFGEQSSCNCRPDRGKASEKVLEGVRCRGIGRRAAALLALAPTGCSATETPRGKRDGPRSQQPACSALLCSALSSSLVYAGLVPEASSVMAAELK